MGTDIHFYVERQKQDGSWERVRPGAWKCAWCKGKRTIKAGPYHETPGTPIPCPHCDGNGTLIGEYEDRNYDLFAMLAGVRNGYGFAGCDTGDGFVPISEPRDLPSDLSFPREPDWNNEKSADEDPWLGDHSFSWCTLHEALSYDYTRKTKKSGVVDSVVFSKWVGGRPESWCGGCSGPNVKHVSNVEMARLIDVGITPTTRPLGDESSFLKAKDGNSYFTRVEWEATYRECAGESWFSFLDACKQLGDPERIRFVFGFDS